MERVIDLLQRVCTVSVETVRIVDELPRVTEIDAGNDWTAARWSLPLKGERIIGRPQRRLASFSPCRCRISRAM